MRYTLRDGKIARQDRTTDAIWPLQVQDGASFLCAERQHDFPWYVSQHAFFRQIGLETDGIRRRLVRNQNVQEKSVVKGQNEKAAKPPPVLTAAEESSIVAREALALTTKRTFLSGEPESEAGKDLRGGARLDPGCKNIHGFAWDKNNQHEPVAVICFVNDHAFFLTLASQHNRRWEKGELIVSRNRNGFHIVTEPLGLKDGDEIDIFFARYKKRLWGCPIKVRNGKLVLSE